MAGLFGCMLAMLLQQLGLRTVADMLCSSSLLYFSVIGCCFVTLQLVMMVHVLSNIKAAQQECRAGYDTNPEPRNQKP